MTRPLYRITLQGRDTSGVHGLRAALKVLGRYGFRCLTAYEVQQQMHANETPPPSRDLLGGMIKDQDQ